MVVMSETKRWQHEPRGATGDCAEPSRAELVSVKEVRKWRSASVGRAGIE